MMLVGIWIGLYWVLPSIFDLYIQSSVKHGLLGQHTIPTTATQGSIVWYGIAETQVNHVTKGTGRSAPLHPSQRWPPVPAATFPIIMQWFLMQIA